MDLFDGHCDTILRCYLEGGGLRRQAGHLDLERRRGKGRWAQFFATFGSPEDMPGRSLWEVFLEEYALFRSEMDANADLVAFCRTGEEARAAFAAGKTVAPNRSGHIEWGGGGLRRPPLPNAMFRRYCNA